MLAFSPPWFSTFGCSLEDEMINQKKNSPNEDQFLNYNYEEPENSESFLPFSSSPPEVAGNDEQPSPRSVGDPSIIKKLSHNANERDRRKKLNGLYFSLRSLLPGTEQSKKLSIPTTISQVVKYIPDLQKQVQRLVERKEEILSQISRQGEVTHLSKTKKGSALSSSFPTVSASRVDEKEVLIQMCTLKTASPLSKVILNLEEEGLQVLNASAFTSFGDRVFYNLHLQVMETMGMECGMLSEKLLSLCANAEDLRS